MCGLVQKRTMAELTKIRIRRGLGNLIGRAEVVQDPIASLFAGGNHNTLAAELFANSDRSFPGLI